MMLLIARAATWMLSIGLTGLYGWWRFSDQATMLPCVGVIGSRPRWPVLASAKAGLFPLVSRANTQRICRVASAHAKFTWPGSDFTSGLRQAIPACRSTVATPAGQEAPPLT